MCIRDRARAIAAAEGARRKAAGICWRTGCSVSVNGTAYCPEHAYNNAACVRERRRELIKIGACAWFGCPKPARKARVYCPNHGKQVSNASIKRRARLKMLAVK